MVIDESVRAPEAAAAQPYDFGRPAALSREHARALAGAFDAFARQWAMQLASKLRIRAHVAVERVSMESYDEYAATVPATTTLVLMGLDGSDSRGVVEFPLSTALAWIVKMVGGDAATPPDERPLTAIEQALVRALMTDTVAHLGAALGDLLPAELSVGGVLYNASFAQVAAPRDLVIVTRFSMGLGERTVAASVVLPAAALLEPALAAADPRFLTDPDVVRRQVEQTPVELTLRLSPRGIRPHEVLGMQLGDVIALPHGQDRPLELAIGDQVVASAAAGTSGARLACVITSSTPPVPSAEESA